jgi:tetratricopeptide (TPR) repeat protein
MTRIFRAVMVIASAVGATTTAAAQGRQTWIEMQEGCGLRPGHFLVNSAVLHLKAATEARFDDVRRNKLNDALRVLTDAVTRNQQESNPAAWYYWGRYYVMVNDVVGMDSSFRKVEEKAPQCKDDIGYWRQQVWTPILNAGIRHLQAGVNDSAIAYFTRANQVYRGRPHGFLYNAIAFANSGNTDSAIVYFKQAAEIAATLPDGKDQRKEALFNLARMYHAKALGDELVRRWSNTRFERDTAQFGIRRDSIAARTARGRDSVTVRRRLARLRVLRDTLTVRSRRDSAAGMGVIQAGIDAYRTYLAEFANDPEALSGLAEMYGLAAWTSEANRLYEAILARADSIPTRAVFQAGLSLTRVDDNRRAAQAFEVVLRRNPNHRDALYELGRIYAVLQDSAKVLPLAQRLMQVDPLNRASVRLVAAGFQLRNQGDSTYKYIVYAESTLVHEVQVSNFNYTDEGGTLSGVISNLRMQQAPAITLTFEFLDQTGRVVATHPLPVPPMDPESVQPLQVEVRGAGIVAWRYKKT